MDEKTYFLKFKKCASCIYCEDLSDEGYRKCSKSGMDYIAKVESYCDSYVHNSKYTQTDSNGNYIDKSSTSSYSSNGVSASTPSASSSTTPTKHKNKVLVPVLVVIIILLCACCIYLLSPLNQRERSAVSNNSEINPNTSNSQTDFSNNRFEATQSDFTRLEELLEDTDCVEFDINTTNTVYVIDRLVTNCYFAMAYKSYFGLDGIYIFDNGQEPLPPDPQNKFPNGYLKLPSDNVKWICENIYHTPFDENFNSDVSYYENGYVYAESCETGKEGYDEVTVTDSTRLADGKYDISVNYKVVGYEGTSPNYPFKVTADLVMINGKREWTFYNVSIF